MVKPVRYFNFTPLCLVIAAALLVASDAGAQQPATRKTSVRHSERAARASWSPRRTSQAAHQTTQRTRSSIRQASQVEIPTPAPEPEAQTSIVQPPIQHVPSEGRVEYVPLEGHVEYAPMDGHIGYGPVHDVGCDALPGEVGCGCGVAAGGCDGYGTCNIEGCSMCGELCSPRAWRPAITIGLPQDGWISYEQLVWWQDGMALPPLVTTSSSTNVARGDAGVLGQPTTHILFGGREVLDESRDGGRLRFGIWLDRCHTWALAGEYFELSGETDSFRGTSSGDPILARPFFNTQTGVQDSELVAFPGVVSGTVVASATSELKGGGFYFKRLRCCEQGCKSWLFCGCKDHFCSRTERLLGYRYLELDENVTITEDLISTDTANPGSFDIMDSIDVRNQFNGFDFGWKYRVTRGYWSYSGMIKMAVGNTRQTVRINGQTTINDPNDPPAVTLPGGLLTQTSNIGVYKQNQFAVVPELNLDIGYQLTDHLKASLGYTFIYWSNVVRPGEQMSLDVNPNLLPPPADPFTGALRPAFAFDNTDYWVQGLNFGLEYRW
jgi:hypothetical protein